MIPVYQTPGHPVGNCLQACIASVLELPIEEVPDFCGPTENQSGYDTAWFDKLLMWSRHRGVALAHFWLEDQWPIVNGCWGIVVGKSPRGEIHHAVVCRAKHNYGVTHLNYVHDPHPSGGFLVGNPTNCILLFKDWK
jgi:hypothetical protein